MSDALDPNMRPGGLETGKTPVRMTNLPKIIGMSFVIIVTMAIYYIGQNNKPSPEELAEAEVTTRTDDYNASADMMFGAAPRGVIGSRAEKTVEPETTVVTNELGESVVVTVAPAFEPEPIVIEQGEIAIAADQPVAPPSEAERRRYTEMENIRLAKFQAFQTAVNAPSKVGGVGTGGQSTQPGQNGKGIGGIGGMSNADAIDKSRADNLSALLAASQAGGGGGRSGAAAKESFLSEQTDKTIGYLQQTLNSPISPYEIKAGTVIPAILITGLNSDLPGQVMAQVSRNVYDTATGKFLLIPQGSRLVGTYDSDVEYGQNRALVAWNRLQYPDGRSIQLEGMQGTDAKGYTGFKDKVDNHYFRIFGTALLMSAIQATSTHALESAKGNTGIGSELQAAASKQFGEVGKAIVEKNLEIAPTIKIRPGYKFTVLVNKDMVLPPN